MQGNNHNNEVLASNLGGTQNENGEKNKFFSLIWMQKYRSIFSFILLYFILKNNTELDDISFKSKTFCTGQ